MNTGFAAASVLSLITWGLHTFAGGAEVAGPLLRSEMPPVAKWTAYYCWHLVTIVLSLMAVSFAYAAFVPSGRDVAALATALSVSSGLWSLVLVVWRYRHPWRLPQWSLFLVISLAAVWGFRT